MLRILGVASISLFAGFALPAAADAQSDLIDQECTPEIWGTYSIRLGTPIGQEFIPAFTSLNFVDLWIVNDSSNLDDSARVFVVVRADSLAGPELGTSDQAFIPKPFDDAIRLPFPTPVALESGRTYLIEARAEGPGNPMLAGGDQLGACPGIRGYFQGRPFTTGADFWFRTGVDPTPVLPRSWGRLKAQYGREEP